MRGEAPGVDAPSQATGPRRAGGGRLPRVLGLSGRSWGGGGRRVEHTLKDAVCLQPRCPLAGRFALTKHVVPR